MNNIFTVKNEDLQKFNPQQAVEVFRDLLWAEARRLGVPINKVRISSRINVRDGGVDAVVEPDEILQPALHNGLIKIGRTAYQIKASSSFNPHQNAEIRNELFGQ